jgi:L-alanine-DL-glutamate epimerase-like enolase superfamily enzyme
MITPRRTFIKALATASASSLAPACLASALGSDELRRHRLSSIEFKRVAQPFPRLVGRNSRLGVHGRGSSPEVAILRTDRGATGWGMIDGPSENIRKLESSIIGKPIDDLFNPASGIRDNKFKGIDIPLHDLAGVILGLPVWKMIGGGEKPLLTRIYSGMIYFDDLEPGDKTTEQPVDKPNPIEAVLENCRWDHAHGYRQLKVKIGRGGKWMSPAAGLQRDIDIVNAIHKALPDCEILVDANNAYTVETVIRFLEGIKDVPLFWFEEPFHETVDQWRQLHAWMKANGFETTRRADGEYSPDVKVLDQLGAEGVINVRLEDIMSLGFTRWREWLPQLAKQNIGASPHAWGSGIKSIYIGHLAAALGNTPTIEGVTCGEDDVELGDNRIVDGSFQASSSPGFGLKLSLQ